MQEENWRFINVHRKSNKALNLKGKGLTAFRSIARRQVSRRTQTA
ncbi:hypothetical protein ACPOL_4346 [Acidisarcina polymorpha]|uniref:Uncharacterized protein n=1 Tax=Acidisarcina polymorpha TaxID=2211140 RepID=A0A2Z5G3C1_9BACT|nr:hypothetical protein ACPOL_4346 [Acidisarcina polymorpha]